MIASHLWHGKCFAGGQEDGMEIDSSPGMKIVSLFGIEKESLDGMKIVAPLGMALALFSWMKSCKKLKIKVASLERFAMFCPAVAVKKKHENKKS